jgi:hypothetical protein
MCDLDTMETIIDGDNDDIPLPHEVVVNWVNAPVSLDDTCFTPAAPPVEPDTPATPKKSGKPYKYRTYKLDGKTKCYHCEKEFEGNVYQIIYCKDKNQSKSIPFEWAFCSHGCTKLAIGAMKKARVHIDEMIAKQKTTRRSGRKPFIEYTQEQSIAMLKRMMKKIYEYKIKYALGSDAYFIQRDIEKRAFIENARSESKEKLQKYVTLSNMTDPDQIQSSIEPHTRATFDIQLQLSAFFAEVTNAFMECQWTVPGVPDERLRADLNKRLQQLHSTCVSDAVKAKRKEKFNATAAKKGLRKEIKIKENYEENAFEYKFEPKKTEEPEEKKEEEEEEVDDNRTSTKRKRSAKTPTARVTRKSPRNKKRNTRN